jgi:hypothetical protein
MSTATAAPVNNAELPSPSPEEVRSALQKLLLSRHLRESAQLQAFIQHIVKHTLAGDQDALKEYSLGCQVFGRRPDYDPRRDGIVRVQATSLRKRLEKYYAEDGLNDAVIIALPRGAYIPAFRYNAAALPDLTPSTPLPWRPIALAFILGLTLAALGAWTLRPAPPYRPTAASPADFPQLWAPFFTPNTPSLVAFGVPLFFTSQGLMIRDVTVNVPGQEAGGRIPDLARKFSLMPTPSDDIYTGVGEAIGTNLMANFLSTGGIPVRVTSARSLGASDIQDQNLIVVSSLRFQTLLSGMKLPSDFEFLGASPERIRNLHPLPGEPAEYVYESGAGVSTSYALVSLRAGANPNRRILSISGVHTWATQAATEFLVEPAQLRKLAALWDQPAHGTPSPFFQILLRVEGRGNHSQKVEYVTHHPLR